MKIPLEDTISSIKERRRYRILMLKAPCRDRALDELKGERNR